jgi:hypothetical protein
VTVNLVQTTPNSLKNLEITEEEKAALQKTEPVKPLKQEPVKKPEPKEVLIENIADPTPTAAEPRRRILPNKSTMGSLLKEVNAEISVKKSDENKVELTFDSLPELWKDFLSHIRHKAQNSFMAVAEDQQPQLEEACIIFTVPNNISLEMLHLHKTEITSYFLSKTTAKVQLEFRMTKKAETRNYKSAKERLREMSASNEAVNKLIQKFDLNLD